MTDTTAIKYIVEEILNTNVIFMNNCFQESVNKTVACNKSQLEKCLNKTQALINFAKVNISSREIYNTLHKLLASMGATFFKYYQRSNSVMDWPYYYSSTQCESFSIASIADFIEKKYLLSGNCKMIIIYPDVKSFYELELWNYFISKNIRFLVSSPIFLVVETNQKSLSIRPIQKIDFQIVNIKATHLLQDIILNIKNDEITYSVDETNWTDESWNI